MKNLIEPFELFNFLNLIYFLIIHILNIAFGS